MMSMFVSSQVKFSKLFKIYTIWSFYDNLGLVQIVKFNVQSISKILRIFIKINIKYIYVN